MKVSYNWLKEYINFKFSPGQLAERLTMVGLEVKSIEEKSGDFIFEAEVTSNRPDWLSIYGIAREIRAISGLKLKPAKASLPKVSIQGKPAVVIEDKKGCSRYVGRIIDNVKVGASPDWLLKRLDSAGIRGVNNIVDATNFCLMELGQPLHAFDYDRLEGGRIIVRRAAAGEEITTIDGIKRKLSAGILVIADAKKPVAIAGAMGGRDTEVTSSTKKVLLESAYFDPPTIRRASKKLGVSTESSYRFERGVDPEGALLASNRAAGLICALAGTSAISQASDARTTIPKAVKIKLRASRANKILGTELAGSKISRVLKSLGLKVARKKEGLFEAAAPSFRTDLKEEIDLIEEIARIYGYDKVAETLTNIPTWGQGSQKSAERTTDETIRRLLSGMGLNEVITYALTSADAPVNSVGRFGEDKIVRIQNPLSSASEALRPLVMGGLLEAAARNINRKASNIKIFELGKSYFWDEKGAPREKGVLAIALCGMEIENWRRKDEVDIFNLKGIIEALFERLGITGYGLEARPSPLLSPYASSAITIGGREIGIFGRVCEELLSRYEINKPVFVSEMDLEPVRAAAALECRFYELPRYPSVTRDIPLIVEDRVSNGEIAALIKEVCGELAVSIRPFDLYRGEQIPKGSKSILYCVEYRAPDRTLTDEEVNGLDGKVREALSRRFNAKLR